MGHFGRAPITAGLAAGGLPGLHPQLHGPGRADPGAPRGAISSPFFLLVPHWAHWPMVFLATAATVIASQAVITGAFSVAHQAVQLGYLPRLRVTHTSAEAHGQIYVPWINWLLMVSVLTLVFAFRSSTALAFAYGMAVTGTITITTLLFFYIARYQWRRPLWGVAPAAAFLLTVDLLFLAANMTKIVHGAWLPLLIAADRVHDPEHVAAGPRDRHSAPPASGGLAAPLRRPASRARAAGGARVRDGRVPEPDQGDRAAGDARDRRAPARAARARRDPHDRDDAGPARPALEAAGDRRARLQRRRHHPRDRALRLHGRTDVPRVLRLVEKQEIECPLEVDSASYFLSKIELVRGDDHSMPRWRKHLFLATARVASDAGEYFHLPRDRTVIVGSRISL